jgi:H+/Na+-translocating ferredoxin:NAD+ oxidoreductase subunit D
MVSVDIIMRRVIFALIPGIIVSTIFLGTGVLIQCALAILFALTTEALSLKLRQQEVMPVLKDGSAVITALLFALCIPPNTLWWINLSGIFFAIVVAKHCFGGLGKNLFNPAMAAYAVLLLFFPLKMTYWADIKGSEWIALAYLAGGLFLLMTKVIRWQIPVTVLGTLIIASLFFNFIDAENTDSVSYHLFYGGTLLCAFFIATDPVTSSSTPVGKIIYAIGIAIFIYVVRTWYDYTDGIAYAILIMNAMVPLLDYYTRPKPILEQE